MTGREAMSQTALVVLVLCAAATTVVTVTRELAPGTAHGATVSPATAPVQLPDSDWIRYSATGHRIGPLTARVTILEFADFECPACRSFATGALAGIRHLYPNDVALVYRYWPLKYHHLAYPAAHAAECAAAQDRFEAFHDALYREQDSLGLKSFPAFAAESRVPDPVAFDRCLNATVRVPAIELDIAAAKALNGHGTPTIIVNGLVLSTVPDSAGLEHLVRSAFAKAAR